jgi:hypothetical protein
MRTITKKITDMSIYGITGKDRWDGSVVIKTDTAITGQGAYFPTRKQAEAHASKLLKELK